MKKVLYVASSGGHFVQLKAYMENTKVDAYKILVCPSSVDDLANKSFILRDANAKDPVGVLRCLFFFLIIYIRYRPDLIVSTGAAPGAVAIFVSKLFFRKSIWIDSIANAKEPSLSGRLVRKIASVWISQSNEVAKATGGVYIGKIFNIY
jgi:UDP-N-acetylglucosamine:LPS N-acetylglucosamine transferase